MRKEYLKTEIYKYNVVGFKIKHVFEFQQHKLMGSIIIFKIFKLKLL